MTAGDLPTWHSMPCDGLHEEREVLADEAMRAEGVCIASIETFGMGWYANALPPRGEGTSSMVCGMIRGGAFGDRVEAARAWCERIAGLHPEKRGDRRSEPTS